MNERIHILTFLLALFVVLPYRMPVFAATIISSLLGRVVIICLAIGLLFVNPTLGAIAIVAAYELVQKSEMSLGLYQSRKFRVTEKVKANQIKEMNKSNPWLKKTLEEEMIDNIPTYTVVSGENANVKPVLGNLHDAARV